MAQCVKTGAMVCFEDLNCWIRCDAFEVGGALIFNANMHPSYDFKDIPTTYPWDFVVRSDWERKFETPQGERSVWVVPSHKVLYRKDRTDQVG